MRALLLRILFASAVLGCSQAALAKTITPPAAGLTAAQALQLKSAGTALQASGGDASAALSAGAGTLKPQLQTRFAETPSLGADFGETCGLDATTALLAADAFMVANPGTVVTAHPCQGVAHAWTFTAPAATGSLIVEGWNNQTLFGQGTAAAPGAYFARGVYVSLPAAHSLWNGFASYTLAAPAGSGCNGLACADAAARFNVWKQGWASSTTTGQEDGLQIDVRGGSATAGNGVATRSSTFVLETMAECLSPSVTGYSGAGPCALMDHKSILYPVGATYPAITLDDQEDTIDPIGQTFTGSVRTIMGSPWPGGAAYSAFETAAPAISLNGTLYSAGSFVSTGGYVYEETAAVQAGGLPATVAPTQTSGSVTEPNGLVWLEIRAGNKAGAFADAFRFNNATLTTTEITDSGDARFVWGAGTPYLNLISTGAGDFVCTTDAGPGHGCYFSTAQGSGSWVAFSDLSVTQALAPAGTTLATAALIVTRAVVDIGGAATANGYSLNPTSANDALIVNRNGGSVTDQIYPKSATASINAQSVGVPMPLPPLNLGLCVSTSATQNYCARVPLYVPPRTLTGSGAIIASDCAAGILYANATAAMTLTVPAAMPRDCHFDVEQQGAGAVTFAGASGITPEEFLASGTKAYATLGQFAKATVQIDSATTFLLSGQVQ